MRLLPLGASACLAAALVVPALAAAPAVGPAAAAPPGLRDVMFVGNNWDGTASIVDAHTFDVLKRGVNLIPDKKQEIRDISLNPVRLALYLAIRYGPGEGHDQYVDDMFTTNDGRYVAVSRPSFADVVWIDIAKATAGDPSSIVREQPMDGYRSDHMALSPDGRRLLVSDSTERQVIEFSMVDETLPDGTVVHMGDRLRTFESGETPHESNYTPDGQLILHASIGKVYTPGDGTEALDAVLDPVNRAAKGDRWFEVVRNSDFSILKRWDMGKELAEAGYRGMSSAVRPMALSPDGRHLYFQVSFLHGYVVFDLDAPDINGKSNYKLGGIPEPSTGAVLKVVRLPKRTKLPRDAYVNDSAHHGLSIDADGDTLCVAATMDDYAALVDVATGKPKIFDTASTGHAYQKPYWTTAGLDDTCWISLSGSDAVAVLDTETGQELAFRDVGNHPQRIRHGYVQEAVASQW